MNNISRFTISYVYTMIPTEYIFVYQTILTLLADYGEEMLKDCKASCTDKNSDVIDCFNMFNSAVAARRIGKVKLADTIIKYVKEQTLQLYKHRGINIQSFYLDEDAKLNAFVANDNHCDLLYTNKGNFKYYVGFGFNKKDVFNQNHEYNYDEFNKQLNLPYSEGGLIIAIPHWIKLGNIIVNGDIINFEKHDKIICNDVTYNVYTLTKIHGIHDVPVIPHAHTFQDKHHPHYKIPIVKVIINVANNIYYDYIFTNMKGINVNDWLDKQYNVIIDNCEDETIIIDKTKESNRPNKPSKPCDICDNYEPESPNVGVSVNEEQTLIFNQSVPWLPKLDFCDFDKKPNKPHKHHHNSKPDKDCNCNDNDKIVIDTDEESIILK